MANKLFSHVCHCVDIIASTLCRIHVFNIEADSLDNAGWNVDILHRDDFSKLLQTIHIFDLTAELGAVENRNNKGLSQ